MAGKEPQKRLGRGLSSLMRTSEAPSNGTSSISASGSGVNSVRIGDIAPNPHQPRRSFRDEDLENLSQSIRHDGILQPLILAKASPDIGKAYVLIAGERRLRAAKRAGLDAVPCIIKEATPEQMLEWAVIENIQREDLNPMERARAFREAMDRFQLTQAEVAERLGLARASVANYLRLLDLCEDVQEMVASGQLSFGHARVLASLTGQEERQKQLATTVLSDGMSVRKLEKAVAKPPADSSTGQRKVDAKSPHVRDLEERLTEAVGTKVRIVPGRAKNTGRIVVEYYSIDDFDRIAEGLGMETDGA